MVAREGNLHDMAGANSSIFDHRHLPDGANGQVANGWGVNDCGESFDAFHTQVGDGKRITPHIF